MSVDQFPDEVNFELEEAAAARQAHELSWSWRPAAGEGWDDPNTDDPAQTAAAVLSAADRRQSDGTSGATGLRRRARLPREHHLPSLR